jgi:hypothetical protein
MGLEVFFLGLRQFARRITANFSHFFRLIRHKRCTCFPAEKTMDKYFRSATHLAVSEILRSLRMSVASGEVNVFKRIMLTLTFAAALGAAGLCLTDKAAARWWGWDRPYVSNYYEGPYYGYGYDVPYRTYNGGYYAPRPYYNTYYGDPGYYYYRPVPRVAVRVEPMWR